MRAAKEAVANVLQGKLRTLLTMLGLIVGISSVIALVGLGEGSNKDVADRIKELGGDIVITYLFDASLSYEDLERMRQSGDLDEVAPSISLSAKISVGKTQAKRGSVEASDEYYLQARDLGLYAGRNLSSVDRANRSKVCLIGPSLAKDLFGTMDVVGRTVSLNGDEFIIVGVFEKQGESAGMLTQNLVVVPISSAYGFGSKGDITMVYARAHGTERVDEAKGALTRFLAQEKRIPADSFVVSSQDEMLTAESSIDETMTLLMGGIASISLIVAGIGVMNVMLVSVAERVREIGIKKALGAQRADILLQFLLEALCISLAGGLCGIAVGIGFGMAADYAGLSFVMSGTVIAVAVSASVCVGLVFGIFPAYRASRLSPIEALRQE